MEPAEKVFHEPPFLCVEILSRRDRLEDIQERIDDYLAFGVRFVWVIDPRSRRAWGHSATGAQEATEGILRTQNPLLAVPMGDLFDQLD